MREAVYQDRLIKKLKRMFPGIVVLKNDTQYMQGIPDLTLLYENMWAMLEVKAHSDSIEQPNQRFYIELFDAMSFGAFIYPENESEVLRDLQRAFKPLRVARVSRR